MVRSCGLPISCTSQLHAHRPKKLAGVSAFDLCKENERSWKEEISGSPRLGNPLYMSYMYSTYTVHIWYKLYITYIIIYIHIKEEIPMATGFLQATCFVPCYGWERLGWNRNFSWCGRHNSLRAFPPTIYKFQDSSDSGLQVGLKSRSRSTCRWSQKRW